LQKRAQVNVWRSRYRLLARTREPAATAGKVGAGCVALGSYGHAQVIEFLFGSTVDGALERVELPIIPA
jgi:hypothetical protein